MPKGSDEKHNMIVARLTSLSQLSISWKRIRCNCDISISGCQLNKIAAVKAVVAALTIIMIENRDDLSHPQKILMDLDFLDGWGRGAVCFFSKRNTSCINAWMQIMQQWRTFFQVRLFVKIASKVNYARKCFYAWLVRILNIFPLNTNTMIGQATTAYLK